MPVLNPNILIVGSPYISGTHTPHSTAQHIIQLCRLPHTHTYLSNLLTIYQQSRTVASHPKNTTQNVNYSQKTKTKQKVLPYRSTRDAKGCTKREVPMTRRRSHLGMSSTAHLANLSGSASPKKIMSAMVCVCQKWGRNEGT